MRTDVKIAVAILAMVAAAMDGSGCRKSPSQNNPPPATPMPQPSRDYSNEPDDTATTEPSTVVVDMGPLTTLPSPTLPPEATRPSPDMPTEYVVQDGDTLWGIAKMLYHDANKVKLIQQANPGLGTLHKGMKLKIPPLPGGAAAERMPLPSPVPGLGSGSVPLLEVAGGAKHTVASGETGWTIAKRYFGDGSKVALLRQANPGVNLDALKIGQVLNIPAGGSVSGGGNVSSGNGSTSRPSGSASTGTPAGDVPHPGMRLK